MRSWDDFTPKRKKAVLITCAMLVSRSPNKELTHEMVEEALLLVVPELSGQTIEDDEFHELVTEVYVQYARADGAD